SGARLRCVLRRGRRLSELSGAATPPVERPAGLRRAHSQDAARRAGVQRPSAVSGQQAPSGHFRKPWLTVSLGLLICQGGFSDALSRALSPSAYSATKRA